MVFFTVSDDSDRITSLDVHEDTEMSTIMSLVEMDFNISLEQHDLYYEGNIVKMTDTLKTLNVKSGDLLFVRKKIYADLNEDVSAIQQNSSGNNNSNANTNLLEQFSNVVQKLQANSSKLAELAKVKEEKLNKAIQERAELIFSMKHDKYAMQILEHKEKALYDAVSRNDIEEVKKILRQQAQEEEKKQIEKQIQYEKALLNPLSEESQKFIAEYINNRQIENNLQMATEHFPEAFGEVYMLYVPVEINKCVIAAFIDSGAQRSVMSKACAERCNILRLLDTRYGGIAKGVGTQFLLGRIHAVGMKIGNKFFLVTLSIIDNDDIDFIFGLDMLKRHQCTIDLKKNALLIDTEHIPFLHEKDIPLYKIKKPS